MPQNFAAQPPRAARPDRTYPQPGPTPRRAFSNCAQEPFYTAQPRRAQAPGDGQGTPRPQRFYQTQESDFPQEPFPARESSRTQRSCRAPRPSRPQQGRAARGGPPRRTPPRVRRRVLAGVCAVLALCVLAAVQLLRRRAPTAYVQPTQPPYTIAMDSGHGGADQGAVGCIAETALTEKTVYYLNGWLKNDPNYVPVYTHTDGTGATIAERLQAANGAKADLLLSVHGNSETAGDSASGFECFPVPPGRVMHEPSLRFAHLVADGMSAAGAQLRGDAGVRYTYYTDSGAKTIAEESDSSVHAEKSFGILEGAWCPALLVEQCFLTNADDVRAWGLEDGCARAARIYYEAICAYFGTQPLVNNA